MGSGLENLLSEGIITEVLARLKSGKEAEVYVVRYGGKVVAAKVYKDRAQRSFKNNAGYKEGRAVRNTRAQRAIDRGSRFGQAAAEDAWKTAEADALYKLHAAGVRVPTPVVFLEGVLLMELVLDGDGEAAPRLIDMTLTVAQANDAYRDMLGQLVRILACDLIHGDLSPYNVLWGAAGPTIIDFPQIVSASHNSRSEVFFLRDARNILGHFASVDRSLNARSGDADEIWRAYMSRELTPDYLPVGRTRPAPPRPRVIEHQAPALRPAGHRDAHREGPRDGRPQPRGGPPTSPDRNRHARAAAPPPNASRQARPARQARSAHSAPEVIMRNPRASGPPSPAPAAQHERDRPRADPRPTQAPGHVPAQVAGESREGTEAPRRRRRRRRH